MGNQDDMIQQSGQRQHGVGRTTASVTPVSASDSACRACFRCGDEYSDQRLFVVSSQEIVLLFECLDVETCARRVSQLRLMGIAGP